MPALLSPDSLAPQPLSHARALPARYYTDAGAVALDARAVFARSLHLVGHESRLQGVGDHLVTDYPSLPMVVIRSDEHSVRD